MLAGDDLRTTVAAWERFAAGAETVQGVRPEILMSWYRCREEYAVDPHLDRAPPAAEAGSHSIDHDVVYAALGGQAASAAQELGGVDGVVTVADGDGRILGTWGSKYILDMAAESNLAPWSTWSEWASGTNGMGTALESHRPVLVRGPEHWCRGFQGWVCAGVAVRDAVTHDPLAVLNISCWQTPLSDAVLPWLGRVASLTEAKLRHRAHLSGTKLAAALTDFRAAPATAVAAVDLAGNVVLANSEAAALLGTPADQPAYSPTHRWTPQLPTLPRLVRRAVERARKDPSWTGSTLIHVPFLGVTIPVAVHPVLTGTQLIGMLLAFGAADGAANLDAPAPEPVTAAAAPAMPSRIVAQRDDRWVLLDPREIRFAEADHNTVWLSTDQGRLVAATRGLDRLEQQLEDKGFLRVHRRFLVNLGRVREVEHGFKGALFLATDSRTRETVPVARRHATQLKQALGL
ncbi:LytTR family transcriptional regulator DNA-binding domain-containing protein [Pseudonocardia zijingensis]|uniref:LytTR family transcriptional regulator DNA-binding domain-containing protein n=1 Tax=Pseudonocardia zijingensis TaxID=153376 RepID=UPI0031DD57C5